MALARIGYNMNGQWVVAPEQWWSAADLALTVLGHFSDVGAAIAMVAMLAWNRRRIHAEKHGRNFDESPPGTTRPQKQ